MPDEVESKKKTLPGLSLERFKAAVESLATLRDSGKLLIFLGRRSSIRIVGEFADDFHKEFAARTEGPVSPDDSKEASREVRNFLATRLSLSSEASFLRFLEDMIYTDELSEVAKSEEDKECFRQLVREKIKCVDTTLVNEALESRVRRIETATGPCVEELEFEVVQSREAKLTDREIKHPFLRLRLRYSEGAEETPVPWAYFSALWGTPRMDIEARSFEFECDTSDIDFLIKRLLMAKQRLAGATKPERNQ